MDHTTALPVRAEQDTEHRLTASQRDARCTRLTAPRKNSSGKTSPQTKTLSRILEGSASVPDSIATSVQTPDITAETRGNEVHVTFGGLRHYRVRGLERNQSSQQLKVNLLVERDGLVHLDTLDLYRARSRASFIKAAAGELYTDIETIRRDIGTLLLKLEELHYQRIESATRPADRADMSDAEGEAAMEFLRDPDLINRILEDYDACGLAGEESNKLVCYLACISRRLAQPLAILIQSGSAAGKTSLMDGALAFVPEEEQVRYSALTGQSLYYMGELNLRHKVLAIAEEQGVTQAAYALKLLQSEGKLSIAAVGKSPAGGRQATHTYHVEGPVMMFLTTTSEHPDPELHNRCLTIRVNESADQTGRIHQLQRHAYSVGGNWTRDPKSIRTLHQNAQRMLEPLKVVMPWADQLTFRSDQTRMRRDHAKYLSLIAAIALLHQYQRKRVDFISRNAIASGSDPQTDFAEIANTGSSPPASGPQPPARFAIEATLEDLALANRLMAQIAGHSLDELLPQTRQLLERIEGRVDSESRRRNIPRSLIRFSQRELREEFGWSDFQVRHHLHRLVELEYVVTHRTGRGNSREYELLYDGQGKQEGQKPFLLGLVDPTKLVPQPPAGSSSAATR